MTKMWYINEKAKTKVRMAILILKNIDYYQYKMQITKKKGS